MPGAKTLKAGQSQWFRQEKEQNDPLATPDFSYPLIWKKGVSRNADDNVQLLGHLRIYWLRTHRLPPSFVVTLRPFSGHSSASSLQAGPRFLKTNTGAAC